MKYIFPHNGCGRVSQKGITAQELKSVSNRYKTEHFSKVLVGGHALARLGRLDRTNLTELTTASKKIKVQQRKRKF